MTESLSSEVIENAKGKFKNEDEQKGQTGNPNNSGRMNVGAYLDHHGISYKVKNGAEGTIYCLDHCLFDTSHTKNESSIIQLTNGKLVYQCFHNSCKDKKWRDARKIISGDDSLKPFMEGNTPHTGKQTQADGLIQEAIKADLFHTPEDEVYARLEIAGHNENWNVRSKRFKKWLSNQYYKREGKAPNAQAMSAALATIEGIGFFEKSEYDVFIRVAEKDGRIYIDLANERWETVEISQEGWRIIKDPPIYFRRPRGMRALPTPAENGNLCELRDFLNMPDDQNEGTWKLTIGWLVQAFRPKGPYPILVVNGEQGAAKSTYSKLLRMIVDPSVAPLRSAPRNERDLVIMANNSWTLIFDNLSGLKNWLSDAICRISTGGGFSTRELWTNDEETLFNSTRPVILNGIDDMVSRHDLADRTIFLTLPPIPDNKRITETELMRRFNKALPRILGSIFTVISTALKNIHTTQLTKMPRMADFALWVQAAEPSLPWERNGFLSVYSENRQQIIELSLEGDMVATAFRNWFDSEFNDNWEGTATELKSDIENLQDNKIIAGKYWPQDVRTFSKKLRRSSNFLRNTGIEIIFDDKARPRKITIHRKLTENNVGDVGIDGANNGVNVMADIKPDNSDINEEFNDIPQSEDCFGSDKPDVPDIKKHIISTEEVLFEEGVI